MKNADDFNDSEPEMADYKMAIDTLEQLMIQSLADQHNISRKKAEELWCSYVDENGEIAAIYKLIDFAKSIWPDAFE